MSTAHRLRTSALGIGLAATCITALVANCTDSYRLPHANGGGGATTTTTSSATGTGGEIMIDSGAGGSCDDTCSNDLKRVVDCKGTTVKDCPPEQACANGSCVADPCMAAETAKSSYGCDYWAVKTAQRLQADGACFAAFVANTWGKPVHLAVERDNIALDVKQFVWLPVSQGPTVTYSPYDDVNGLGVGEVAVLFLSRLSTGSVVACPKQAAVEGANGETGVDGTGIGKGFHITTDYPVVAYQMTPYGGGQAGVTSATLLLPTSAWGMNYVAVSGYPAANQVTFKGGLPSLDILAYKDNTKVTILPRVDIVAGTNVAGATANMPVEYTLNKGEFLQVTQAEELSGSPIQSTEPIAVFGASACMEVPSGQGNCDSGQQQIPPVSAMGSEYVGVIHKPRNGLSTEAPPWRFVGAVDGTVLTWEGNEPAGAPKSLDLGQVAEIAGPGPFVVKSQDAAHPFYLGGYMTGGQPYGGEGDPDWVNVIPPQQYLDHYVLFTDPTYPETNLVVVRTPSKVDGKFAEVNMTCSGGTTMALTGWKPAGSYEYTRVQLVTGDFTSVDGCNNGRQEIQSDQPFGVTVWGWGATQQTQFVSYAYPAGAGFQPINEVTVPTIPK